MLYACDIVVLGCCPLCCVKHTFRKERGIWRSPRGAEISSDTPNTTFSPHSKHKRPEGALPAILDLK